MQRVIDLNHGSGSQYEGPSREPGIAVAINAAIDVALVARNRAQPPRRYVSSSGLGRECLRQIQFDYLAVPKDQDQEFQPKTLRIFEAGHRGEDIVAAWLRDRAEKGVLLPFDELEEIQARLEELSVTVSDFGLPGPMPPIDALR